jgi:UDP-N-acetylglucosamine 1-carboxyvinyltransferase
VQGVDRLHGARHSIVPDRIETGTYAVAAAITGGDIELVDTEIGLMEALGEVLESGGISVAATERGVRVSCPNGRVQGVDVMTEPFPGFPTDLQAQFMALMTVAEGAAMITETIFENRFMHVPELVRMGANINVHGASAMVRGVAP